MWGRFLSRAIPHELRGKQALKLALRILTWLSIDRLYRMGTAMVAGVLVARYLGPTRFGWLAFAIAAVTMITSFTELGINSIVVRELVREPEATNELMGAALLLRGSGALLGLLACVVIAVWGVLPVRTEGVLMAVLGSGLIFQVFDLFDLLLQASGVPRITAWIRIAANTLVTAMKLALIVLGAPVEAFAVMNVCELGLCALGWWLVGRRRGWRISRWSLVPGRIRFLMRESWPVAISGLAVYTQAYADQLVVGSMLGGRELGQYAAAMRLINVFAFLPMVVQIVAAPEIARAKVSGDRIYLRRLHDVYRVMMLLFLMAALPLMLLGPEVVRVLYGRAYYAASGLLPWLALRLFFSNFGIARSMFITNDRLFRFALSSAAAGAVTNVAMNLVLVPRWGIMGAIVSSLTSFAVTTFALDAFDRRARPNFKLMISAVVMPWRPLPVQEAGGI